MAKKLVVTPAMLVDGANHNKEFRCPDTEGCGAECGILDYFFFCPFCGGELVFGDTINIIKQKGLDTQPSKDDFNPFAMAEMYDAYESKED